MQTPEVILMAGDRVILRDQQPTDIDAFVKMQTSGEWRHYDAPWEGIRSSLSPEEESRYRAQFLENCAKEKPSPCKIAVIVTQDGQPIGTVNRYGSLEHPDAWFVGIDIFADECLNKGLGSEALKLWVDYLFTHSNIHRIGLDTWSFNLRMIRVAQKLGFAYEGAQREMQFWENQWLDLLHFGMLRSEWESLRKTA